MNQLTDEQKDVIVRRLRSNGFPSYSRSMPCRWVFKSPDCGYVGERMFCQKTIEYCESLGNQKRFVGRMSSPDNSKSFFSVIPSIKITKPESMIGIVSADD